MKYILVMILSVSSVMAYADSRDDFHEARTALVNELGRIGKRTDSYCIQVFESEARKFVNMDRDVRRTVEKMGGLHPSLASSYALTYASTLNNLKHFNC